MYVHRPYTLPSDTITTVDAYDKRLDWTLISQWGNYSPPMVQRKNEKADLEKWTRK